MDSGSAAPTLRPGVSDTLAENELINATCRCGGERRVVFPISLRATWRADSLALAMRSAFILARERAGKSSPARTAIMAMTTRSSIRVKPRREVFIQGLCCATYDWTTRARNSCAHTCALYGVPA